MDVAEGSSLRRNVKDSVFCDLFSIPEYVFELYRDLHPEDNSSTVDDVDIVTLQSVLTSSMHNDLGFTVGNRLLVLVEAQSTWSPNIVLRALLYVAQTLRGWVRERGEDIYGSVPVEVPRPELYVVYTGKHRDVPAQLTLSGALWGSEASDVEVTLHVLRGERGGLVGEYVSFTEIADTCRNEFADAAEAARETVRRCMEQDVLTSYLSKRTGEVVSIMMMLYDAEEVQRIYVENQVREGVARGMARGVAEGMAKGRAEGMAKGRAEGMAKGRAEGMLESLRAVMRSLSLSAEQAMDTLAIPEAERAFFRSALARES